MSKLGSEFLDSFEKEEGKLLGVQKRILLLLFSMITSIILIIAVVWFKLPDILYYIYLIIIGIPGTFFGVSADKHLRVKDRIYFFFLERVRTNPTPIEKEETEEKEV